MYIKYILSLQLKHICKINSQILICDFASACHVMNKCNCVAYLMFGYSEMIEPNPIIKMICLNYLPELPAYIPRYKASATDRKHDLSLHDVLSVQKSVYGFSIGYDLCFH